MISSLGGLGMDSPPGVLFFRRWTPWHTPNLKGGPPGALFVTEVLKFCLKKLWETKIGGIPRQEGYTKGPPYLKFEKIERKVFFF